jgi:RNase P/RNase MRP subunit p29
MKNFIILFLSFIMSTIAYADVAGVISLATKDVTILAADGSARAGITGDAFKQGETILTAKGGKTQLLFKDQMTINLSQDSELKVDEFIFSNPQDSNNKLTTSIKKGAFKFISGKISDNDKNAMKVKTPKTSIAIRGTGVIGDVSPEEENIVLLDGAIEITSNQTQASELLTESGLGVSIDQAGILSQPVIFDPARIDSVFEKVNLTEVKPATENAEAQTLVSTLSKTMLEDEDNALVQEVGKENAVAVAEGLLSAADSVIATSGNSSNVSVGEVFSTFATQNAELVSKILGDEDINLTSLDNVVVSANIFLYMASGYDQPSGTTITNFADGRNGIISKTFNDIRLGGNQGDAQAGSSGNMTATIQIDTGAASNAFRANTIGSATLNGDSYNLNVDTGWIDGTVNDTGDAFDPATDSIDQLNLIGISPDLLDGTSYSSLTGAIPGNTADFTFKITAGPFSGTGTDYTKADAMLQDTTPGASLNTYIDGIQEILAE